MPDLAKIAPDGRSRDHVASLERGLAVMEILAANPAGMTLTEVAQAASLTRAGARRLLLTLASSGYATQAGRRFLLSTRLLSLSRQWLSGASLWTFAEPFMKEVAAALNESCSGAVLADEDVVYMARVPGRRIMSVALHVGTHLPAWCTAMGRAILSGLPEAELDAFLARAAIRPLTPKTVTDRAVLGQMIRNARKDGFVIVDEELELGLRTIAVPLHDRHRRIVAAINVSAQASRYTPDEMRREILPPLAEAARRIEDFFVVQ